MYKRYKPNIPIVIFTFDDTVILIKLRGILNISLKVLIRLSRHEIKPYNGNQ